MTEPTTEQRQDIGFEIAFEKHGVSDTSDRLWRVSVRRDWKGKKWVPFVNWFASREQADQYVAWLATQPMRSEVLSVVEYLRAAPAPSEPAAVDLERGRRSAGRRIERERRSDIANRN